MLISEKDHSDRTISDHMKTHTICHNARRPPSFSHICSLTLRLLISVPLFLPLPPSRFLPLINSTGVPSDAFQAPSSFHRLGLDRRPEGYWLNRLKLGVKTELSSLKIKTLLPRRVVDRECQKAARSLWTSEEQKLFYLLDRHTAAFKKQSQAGRENNVFWKAARRNKQDRVETNATFTSYWRCRNY